jgi:predicted nucleotidyltransferase
LNKKEEMDSEKIRIVKDLKNRLSNQLADNLKEVILFGSQLTNNNTQDSDYDILIIVKQKVDWQLERRISDICYEIDLKYGILTDTHILSENELNSPRGRQPIFFNAINHGYHV